MDVYGLHIDLKLFIGFLSYATCFVAGKMFPLTHSRPGSGKMTLHPVPRNEHVTQVWPVGALHPLAQRFRDEPMFGTSRIALGQISLFLQSVLRFQMEV